MNIASGLRWLSLFFAIFALSVGAQHVRGASMWDGGGANANWDTLLNWVDDALPLATDNVTIGSGFASGAAIDLNGDRTVNSLILNTTTAFSLNDDTITLTSGDFTRNGGSGVAVDINSNVRLGSNGLWNIATPSSVTNVNGAIGDGGSGFGIHFTPGANRSITLAGDNTFDGDLEVTNTNVTLSGDNSARSGDNIINSGSLRVSHVDALGTGKLFINGGNFLLGIAADVTITNDWEIAPGATFSYSGNGGGTEFTMTGDLAPLTGDVSFQAAAGGGSSRQIVIEDNIDEAAPSNLTILGGSHGSQPIFNGDISISGDITVQGTGGQNPRPVFAGDNSGTLGDLIVDGSLSSANIQLLNPAALTAGTFVIDAANFATSLADDGSTTVKTFNGALQWGGTIDLDQENMQFTGNMLISSDLLFRTGPANGILELAGNISDGGNGFSIKMEPEHTRSGRLILSGNNSFTGGLIAELGGTSGNAIIELNGSLSNANITLGAGGRLEGTGTVFFQNGDMIDVGGVSGLLNATSLTFDLSAHQPGTYTIVDFTDGTFNGPGTLDDLLSANSVLLGWTLTNTGTQISAFREIPPVPEPSSLMLLALGLVALVRKRRKSA